MQPHERKQWSSLKNGSIFKIMIDESFSSFEQVEGSVDFGHAVNIKSEKAGGPISCIRAAIEAAKFKMEVVFGSMVSTHLGCNQTYCLHPLTKWLDVDGSLLV
jgi:L-alanine-DL-glutamate epimerase-like enolase superfamily enzyme